MASATVSHNQIIHLLSDLAHIEAPSVETDLMESGLLDSLTLVELMSGLEEQFGVCISFDDIELENFRSVKNIAEFVGRRSASQTMTASQQAG